MTKVSLRSFACTILMLSVLLLGLTACQARAAIQTIEAPALIDVSIEGIEGQATAEAVLLDSGLQQVLGLDDAYWASYQIDPEAVRAEADEAFREKEALVQSLQVHMSPQTHLKNGDIVTVTVEADEAAWEALGFELKLFSWDVRAKGLAPLRPISLTDGLVLQAVGFNGQGQATLSNPTLPDVLADKVSYRPARTERLSNGDMVRVEVLANEHVLAQEGLVATSLWPVDLRVEGLQELEQVDLTGRVALQFEGFEGEGLAELVGKGLPQELREWVSYTLSPAEGLANGDLVRVTADYDADLLLSEGFQVSGAETLVEVVGLQEWVVEDAFADVQLSVQGISGEAQVALETYQLPLRLQGQVEFTLDPVEGLANGDEVTVYAVADHAALQKRGVRLEAVEKRFTLSGLREYPLTLDAYDLDGFVAEIDPLVQGLIDQRIVSGNGWQPRQTQSVWDAQAEHALVGMYYLWEREAPGNNHAALIYEVQVSGRITSYRRGLRESYSRNGRATNTVYLTVRVPGLEFTDAVLSGYGVPRYIRVDDSLSEARMNAVRTSNADRMQVLRVGVAGE